MTVDNATFLPTIIRILKRDKQIADKSIQRNCSVVRVQAAAIDRKYMDG